jgi:hypothetical protein
VPVTSRRTDPSFIAPARNSARSSIRTCRSLTRSSTAFTPLTVVRMSAP